MNPSMPGRRLLLAALISAGIATGGCSPPGRPPADPAAGTLPVDEPTLAPEVTGREFRVDPQSSEVRVVLFAAGLLARFGHPHVIGGPAISGRVVVAEELENSALELMIHVDMLEVDRPEWRLDEGFEPDMDAATIDDTRRNMLGDQVLDAQRYPEILIRSTGLTGPPGQPDLTVQIHLKDQVRELTVPVALEFETDRLTATGRIHLLQSEFGIEPFSAVGGRLQVADEMIVRFRIVARAPE